MTLRGYNSQMEEKWAYREFIVVCCLLDLCTNTSNGIGTVLGAFVEAQT